MTMHHGCYWTRTARDSGRGSALEGTIEADVAIIGGGIVGIIAARLLKDRGKTVAIIEAGRAGFGVTGRSTAKVTAQHAAYLSRIEREHGEDAARIYAEANIAGVELIAGLNDQYGLQCDFEPADSWAYASTDEGAAELEEEQAAVTRAGLAMELTTATDLPFPVTAALRLPSQWQFQPADFVAQLAATINGDGSFLFEDCPATCWSDSHVETEGGCVRASQVIMATHLPLGREGEFGACTRPHMHAVMAVPVDPKRAPPGMYISIDQPKRSLRSHRRANGEAVLILTGPVFKHGDAEAEGKGFAELERFGAEHFGTAGGGWRWTNEDYTPRDHLPYIGWSGGKGKSPLVATGFDAWGLSNGAAAAQILADLIEGRDNPWATTFDASRHSLKGAGELASNAAGFVAELVGKHAGKAPRFEPGKSSEGDVVDCDGRAAGLYRCNGELKAVSAVCTHMGCMVGWNPIDRTWDCPCHGSRFAEDGRVIHGPAVEALHEVALDMHQTEELEP